MRTASFVAIGATLLLATAACGGGTQTSQPPATSSPVTTPAPVVTIGPGVSTAAPPTQGQGSPAAAGCPGVPPFDPGNLPPDADLAALLPEQIDGQPVTGVETYNWMQFMCARAGKIGLDAWKSTLPDRFRPILTALSYGSADATADGEAVEIRAFRAAGQDAEVMAVLYGELSQMVMGEMPTGFSNSVSHVTLGGKEVTVWTDDADGVAYLYPSGDVLFVVANATESQADKVFVALP